jgi:hypothetical protein
MAEQADQHPFHALDLWNQLIGTSEIAQVRTEDAQVFQLGCGSQCVNDEAREVHIGSADASFRDVRRKGSRRSSHLT